MKAVRIHELDGDLRYEDAPEPVPGTGDVVVRVHAAGFVPDELTWPSKRVDRAGRDRTPAVPAHELAGVVTSLSYGTAGLAVGDRVFGLTDFHRDGAAAEYIAVEARNLARIPEGVDFAQAAALPLAGLTALQGLFTHGGLRAGQTVMIHGAAGGTGSLAVQLAKNAGATVIGTGRAAARALALDLGADTFVELGRDELPGQVDLVFDTVGGEVLERSAAAVKPGGVLVSITAPPPVVPQDGRAVFFIVESDRAQLGELAALAGQGRLRAHVGAVFPLSKTAEAFTSKRHTPGKTILEP
ncbi:NADP-dependent oxidoreductase [Nonomuraea longicatena]|uniref:NADP-dependent oxidoreductase n=1 Tax=Nonomuraea longicatena TaxID=83682 RepID=A0ABN1P5X7_9ACTN